MAESIGLAVVLNTSSFTRGFATYQKGLNRMNRDTDSTVSKLNRQFSALGTSVLSFGANVGAGIVTGVGVATVALGGLTIAAIDTAVSFESAFAGVLKTVDDFSKIDGGVAGLRQQFVDLSKEIPLAFEELAKIGELGGQLGIATEDLGEFTETVAALGVSTNLSTEEAATSIARLQNIYAGASEDMQGSTEQIGSAIVELGNNFATTERDITNFASRIAGAGAIAGLSQADILGVGAAFSSVGIESEAGGTAVQKVLLGINNAVNATSDGVVDYSKKIDGNVKRMTKLQAESARLEAQFPGLQSEILAQRDAFIAAGGNAEDFGRQLGDKTRQKALETALSLRNLKDETQLLRDQHGQPIDSGQLEQFAAVAGLSAEEFKQAWQEDATGAFEMFVMGLAAEGDNAATVLDELGLADQRLVRAFLSLAGAGDLLTNAIDTSNEAFEEGTALGKEAAQRYATTESQLKILKNTLRATGDIIGSKFLPFINRAVQAGKGLIEDFSGPLVAILDTQVIPAIEGMIALGGELAGAFATGGTAGLIAALGITPEATELLDKIVNSVITLGGAIVSTLGPSLEGLASGGALEIINQAIMFMNEHFVELQGAIIGVGAVVAGGVFVAIAGALASLLSPITILIAAAALLGAAWAGNWGNIQGVTMSVITTITGIVMAFVDAFMSGVLPPLQEAFNNITVALNSMGLNWSDVWNAVVSATQIVAAAIGVVILGIITIIAGLVAGIASGLATATGFLQQFGSFFTMIIEGVAMVFAGFVNLFSNLINGEWAAAWEGFSLAVDGANQIFIGIIGSIITFLQAGFATALSIITGFGQVVMDIFTNLSNVLVGNSIIPDMVNSIIETFLSMVEPILSTFGGLAEGIGSVLSGIFGEGGEGEGLGLEFEPAEMTTGLTEVQTLITNITAGINNITAAALPALIEGTLITLQAILPQWQMLFQIISQIDLLIIKITTETLPALGEATIVTVQIMVVGFQQVITVVTQLLAIFQQLIEIVKKLGQIADESAKKLVKAFTKAANTLKTILLPAIMAVVDAFDEMASSAKAAGNAASGAGEAASARTGVGFKSGVGFANGTLGFTVPGGTNQPFPITVHGQEEMIVAPANKSLMNDIIMPRMMRQFAGLGSKSININISVGNINNGMDLSMLQNTIRQTVSESL